jgi:hypothetical protein
MPDVTVVTPAAVVPADRLTLGAVDARASLCNSGLGWQGCFVCMAEE